jgi:uncharacterized phage-like protein YoqJ
MIKDPVITITGHRPPKLGGYDLNNEENLFISYRTHLALKRLKPSIVISGMALGADQMAVVECLRLGIPYIVCLPFLGQESMWPLKAQNLYHKLLDKALKIEVVSEGKYEAWKMQARNERMVDSCDLVLGIWDGIKDGGTWNCLRYAQLTKKHIEYIMIKKGQVL